MAGAGLVGLALVLLLDLLHLRLDRLEAATPTSLLTSGIRRSG
jgi:hypothetical protein